MTDNEIIKALECCSDWENSNSCNECPFYEELDCATTDRLDKYALDLINRQKAEIENLNKALSGTIALNHEERKVLKAEIERLNNELKITREYLHDNGLEFDLLSYNKRNGG
jgi:hypothetical protein